MPEEKGEQFPVELPILPLRNTVVFPVITMPLSAGRERSLKAIEVGMEEGQIIGILAQMEADVDDPDWEDLYHVGTACRILKQFKLPDGSQNILVEGLYRFQAKKFSLTHPYIRASVAPLEDEVEEAGNFEALVTNLRNLARKAIGFYPTIPQEVTVYLNGINDSSELANIIASYLNLSVEEKQEVLETTSVKKRLVTVTRLLTKEIEVLELGQKIQSEIKGEIDKSQREYYLKKQLEAIKRELGESGETSEVDDIRDSIETGGMPDNVKKVALKELDRLTKTPEASAEHGVIRTYLDWLTELPWTVGEERKVDLDKAETVLERDHYGLEKVKKRIMEYLAVRKLKSDIKGPILCLVGPPGVGKTSLGKSIAEALDRKFVRASLGGVRDEAEIRGHRRTYVGSLPGRVIQGIKKAGAKDPVFMLDEIDKLGSDFRGDPSSALLEVLDPEQNNEFSDHYLEVPYDLSKVLFVCTANQLDTIPGPLLDRLEVIQIPGYTSQEKAVIAKTYLVPDAIANHGLTEAHISISDEAVDYVIDAYTREAGVRNLKREVASLCRGVAKDVAMEKVARVEIGIEQVEEILGPPRFITDLAERMSDPGVAIGLAWTPVGGDILFIEATMMRGKGHLKITGRLGDVMRESAETAMSYVRSKAKQLGIDQRDFVRNDFHIHIPAGAIPKDGPSAGVTLLTALTSLLTGRQVRHDLAMTGEISLRGAVLPIGGLKEKVLAAKRAGVTTVIVPEKNRKDLVDIPEEIKENMTFVFASRVHEVLEAAIQDFKYVEEAGLIPEDDTEARKQLN